jgi:hypothetical protein
MKGMAMAVTTFVALNAVPVSLAVIVKGCINVLHEMKNERNHQRH